MKILQNINKSVFFPSLIVIIAIIIPLYLYPTQSNSIINIAFRFCTQELGWVYMLACLTSFGFIFWVTFGERGDIIFGEQDEKPEYNTFSWIAMLFTAGVGTSIIILGFVEPIYYVSSPPMNLEPFSTKAYEYAHMYGQFHWGLSAWAFYAPAIVAVAYTMFNRKKNVMTLSGASVKGLGRFNHPFVRNVIDITVVFGIVGSISTSLGLGTPVIGAISQYVFSIPEEYTFTVNIVIILIWMCIFGVSLFHGLDRGIKKLSSFNIYLAIIFMALIFFYGPSIDLIKMEINSIGLYLQNFIQLNTWTDPFGTSSFIEDWTIFYWAWWLAFMPMMGLFIARISRGRSIRSVVWGQIFWGSLGCALSFAIFGGYSLYLQQTGIVDLATILQIPEQGQTQAIVAILQTLPFAKIAMLVMCLLCFIYLATTISSCAYVLASSTTKELPSDEQPARWNRILWSVLFCLLSIGLMLIGGLKAVQTISIVVGFPLAFVLVLLIRSVVILLREDMNLPKDTGKKDIFLAP